MRAVTIRDAEVRVMSAASEHEFGSAAGEARCTATDTQAPDC